MHVSKKWLQIGLSKSGNVWLYNLLRSVARHAGLEQKSFIRNQPIHPIAKKWDLSFPEQADIDTLVINPTQCLYRISSIFSMPIDDLDAYVAGTTHAWTHSFFGPLSSQVFTRFDRVIYIVRDPRDVAISLSRFNFTPYRLKYYPPSEPDAKSFLERRFGEILQQWVEHVAGYLEKKEAFHIHFIFYERLLGAFDDEFRALSDFLGITLGPREIAAIKKEVSFENMKIERPQHLRKGESGQWREALSPKQLRMADALVGSLLSLLNYPAGNNPNGAGELPHLPGTIDLARLEGILRRARRWGLLAKAGRALTFLRRPLRG